MQEIITSAIVSIVLSAIYNKISAVHTLNVIDGYVNSMTHLIKELIRDTSGNKRTP